MLKEKYIGVMSGTSLDGVDVVLCEIDAKTCTLISSLEYPFPSELKTDILEMIDGTSTLKKLGEMDHRLGYLFADAVNALCTRESIATSSILAIGSHGQTLWHEPKGENSFTMQLGNPNILVAETSMPVVADFRRKDMALGGQGAPFAPAFHEYIFNNINDSLAVVNIGGMANITVIDNVLVGYDTGCGNVLLDLWINKHQNISYDKDGVWARSGSIDYVLLDEMMADSYFALDYPKSTGREKFNNAWLEYLIKDKEVIAVNVQRTLLELTALSITNEVLKFNRDIVFLCGGGAKNKFLVERIKSLVPNIEVVITDHSDMLEAMMFAWLAYKRIHKEEVNLKDVTGACKNTVLGGIYE